jgi:hypothetical protein
MTNQVIILLNDFDLDIREHLLSGTNRGIYAAGTATSDDGNTANEAKLAFGFSQGKAYVKGYEIEKIGTTYIDVNKARDFETASGSTTRFDIGSFVNVEDVYGTPDINFVSGEIENYKTLRLVDTAHGYKRYCLWYCSCNKFMILVVQRLEHLNIILVVLLVLLQQLFYHLNCNRCKI